MNTSVDGFGVYGIPDAMMYRALCCRLKQLRSRSTEENVFGSVVNRMKICRKENNHKRSALFLKSASGNSKLLTFSDDDP